MAKDRLELLNHWNSTKKNHKVSDLIDLLSAFGFSKTSKSNSAGDEFSNGEKSEYFKVDNLSAYVGGAVHKKVAELCESVLKEHEMPGNEKSLIKILAEEKETLTEMKENYGIDVSVASNGKAVIFRCDGLNMKEHIKREGPFDLGTVAAKFTGQVERELYPLLSRIEKLSTEMAEDGKSLTATHEGEEFEIPLFGEGFPDKSALKAAEKAIKKINDKKEAEEPKKVVEKPKPIKKAEAPLVKKPIVAVEAVQDEAPEAAAAEKPIAIDQTRTITGGQMLPAHIESKQFMWNTLNKLIGIQPEHGNIFIPVFQEMMHESGCTIKKSAIDEFLNPDYKFPPTRKNRGAVANLREQLVGFVRDMEHEGEVDKGTAKKFEDAFRDIQRQMETKKDQQAER